MEPGEVYIANFRLDTSAGPIGMLDEMTLREVVKAIGYVIESDCEPV